MTIQKLIEQYQAKVAECDKGLADLNELNAKYRLEGNEKGQVYARGQFLALDAQRQIFVQFTKDLEDLND